jgi:hypothetical protein
MTQAFYQRHVIEAVEVPDSMVQAYIRKTWKAASAGRPAPRFPTSWYPPRGPGRGCGDAGRGNAL